MMLSRQSFAMLLLSAGLGVLTSGCSAAGNTSQLPANTQRPSMLHSSNVALTTGEAQNAMDPQISGDERAMILSYVSSSTSNHIRQELADPSHRVNIAIYDSKTGRFYTNRANLHGRVHAYRPIDGTSNLYKDDRSRQFIAPAQTLRSNQFQQDQLAAGGQRYTREYQVALDHGTGPYRRLETSPNDFNTNVNAPLSSNSILALPPCGSQHYAVGSRDAGSIFVGGWGTSAGGFPIDAGVEHTLPVSGSDNYQMFMNINGTYLTVSTDTDPNNGTFPHFNCGSTVTLFYSIAQDGYGYTTLNLEVNGNYIAYRDSSFEAASNGYNIPCDGCILKKVTSIAQMPEGLLDGSSFGPVTWQLSTISCDQGSSGCNYSYNNFPNYPSPATNSTWEPAEMAYGGCMEYPQWEDTGYPPPYPDDCNSTPGGSYQAVQVNFQSTSAESVTIALPQGPVAPGPAPIPTATPTPRAAPSPKPCIRQTCPQVGHRT